MLARQDAIEYEQQVREIGRILWPQAEYGGAKNLLGRERDGVFETDDVIHVVEATISRQRIKALEDAEKSRTLIRALRKSHPDKAIRGWIVTRDEPTPDQREALEKFKVDGIRICSFSQFTSRIIDAPTYLQMRMDYPFGSARNLVDQDDSKNVGHYVEVNFLEDTGQATEKVWSFESIIQKIQEGTKKYSVFR